MSALRLVKPESQPCQDQSSLPRLNTACLVQQQQAQPFSFPWLGETTHPANDPFLDELQAVNERAFSLVYRTPSGAIAQLSITAEASSEDEVVGDLMRAMRRVLRGKGCSDVQLFETTYMGAELGH